MDASLKLLADASLEVSAAEDALGDGSFHSARDRLDAAAAVLDELRAAWPQLPVTQRAVVGPAARAVRQRLDAATVRMPRLSALSVTAPTVDPEHDQPPD